MKRDFSIALQSLLAVCVLGVAGLAVGYVWNVKIEPPARQMKSRYHPVSMEGVSCTVDGVGIAFDAMDVYKRKAGGLTLGGFNVLEMKNLCLTLYRDRMPEANEKGPGGVSDAEGLPLHLPAAVSEPMKALRSLLPPQMKVSGVDIAGVRILQARAGETPQLWLEAARLKNRGRELWLSGTALTTNGVRRIIGDARLAVKDGVVLEVGTNANERIRLL